MLVELDGWYEHYTVIAGYTPTIFRLFDSGALRWLSRELCGPSQGRRDWVHKIDIATLTVLSLGSG